MKRFGTSWKQGFVLAAAALGLFCSTPAQADSQLTVDPAVVALHYTPQEQDYFDNHQMYGYGNYNSFDTNDVVLMKDRRMVRLATNDYLDRKTESWNDGSRRLDIKTGTTVSFWAESGQHSLQSGANGVFPQVVPLGTGQMYSYTFLKPGTYTLNDSLAKVKCQCDCMTINVTGNALTAASYLPQPIARVQEQVQVLDSPPAAPIIVERPAPAAPAPIAAKPPARVLRPRDADLK